MFGEFNETAQPKTSLAKYSIEFNLFSCTNASASNSVFEAVRQTLHITVCEMVCGQTRSSSTVEVDLLFEINDINVIYVTLFLNRFFLSCSLFPFC